MFLADRFGGGVLPIEADPVHAFPLSSQSPYGSPAGRQRPVAYGLVAPRQSALRCVMPLQCNIDSRGRAARLIYGVVMVVAGLAMALLWARGAGSVWAWALTIAVLAGGA